MNGFNINYSWWNVFRPSWMKQNSKFRKYHHWATHDPVFVFDHDPVQKHLFSALVFIHRHWALSPRLMDGQMKEGGVRCSGFTSPPSFFPPHPCAPSQPRLAPSSPSPTLCSHPLSTAQEWRSREWEERRMWLAPFHLSWLQDQIIGLCVRIADNCSLYSAP